MKSKKYLCPCTKEECPLYSQSSSGRNWCDNDGDPSRYERCPIPKKRKQAIYELRIPSYRGENVEYETESDIELAIILRCEFETCKTKTRLRLRKGCSSGGYYHNKRYGQFDMRNVGFVCDKHQAAYDKFFKKKGWLKETGGQLMSFNQTMG